MSRRLVARPEGAACRQALLLFYVLAVDRLGFLPTAAVIVLIDVTGARRAAAPRRPVAIGAPLFVNLVFSKLLARAAAVGTSAAAMVGLP